LANRKVEVVARARDLVERIVIYPNGDERGRDLELVGQLGPPEKVRSCMCPVWTWEAW